MRLIINGKAAGSPELREAVKQLRDRRHVLETRVTWEGGDAARFAEESLQDNVDVVIAAGGDGTIDEVVTGLMKASNEPQIAVGVVPFGTANDFANGCGIPTGMPGTRQPFDIMSKLRRIAKQSSRRFFPSELTVPAQSTHSACSSTVAYA